MSTNIYKKLNLTSTSLLQKQKTFPALPCIATPMHKVKEKDESGNEIEKDVASLEVGKAYQIMRTELKEKSSSKKKDLYLLERTSKEKDLYLIVGSVDGLLFMNEEEVGTYFDLSVLKGERNEEGINYKLTDAPFYKTGMVIENRE